MTSPALQEVVALLGCPAAGTPAQYLFERMIAAAGLDWQFVTLDVQPERIAEAVATNVVGAGVDGVILNLPAYVPGSITRVGEALRPVLGL